MGWFRDSMEEIGKWIPNEVSKTNSIGSKLPYVGPFVQGFSAADNFATAYGDTGDLRPSFQSGMAGAQGLSRDPGVYGSPNKNEDVWNQIGQAGNLMHGQMPDFDYYGGTGKDAQSWLTRYVYPATGSSFGRFGGDTGITNTSSSYGY